MADSMPPETASCTASNQPPSSASEDAASVFVALAAAVMPRGQAAHLRLTSVASACHRPTWVVWGRRLAVVEAAHRLALEGIAIELPLVAVPTLLIVGGGLTGSAFPGLAAFSDQGTRRSAGIAFAADEIGAAAGAVLVGMIAIPWAGITATAVGLAFVSMSTIPAVVIALRRK